MNLKKTYGINAFECYYNPGETLSDEGMLKLFGDLVTVNRQSKKPIEHGLLPKVSDVSAIKALYKSCMVCVIRVGGELSGFLISPILKRDNIVVAHTGLVMININRGDNLIALASAHSGIFLYSQIGAYITTNISSTPSIIEVFSRIATKPWPCPNASLIKPYKGYKQACQVLFEDYVQKIFLNPEDLEIDYRRFVIRSKSQDMGFTTDLRKISRSADFKFMNFCFTWLDYEKEEDLVQIGKADFRTMVKFKLFLFAYRFQGRLMGHKGRKVEPQTASQDLGLQSTSQSTPKGSGIVGKLKKAN